MSSDVVMYTNGILLQLNQTKTLSAAFWVFVVLGKGQSRMQIVALLLLVASAVVLNLDAVTSTGPDLVADALVDVEEQLMGAVDEDRTTLAKLIMQSHQHIAVICVMAASMLSGVSAALTQKVLTMSSSTNSLLVSAELAVYGILFLVIKEVFWDLDHLTPYTAIGLLLSNFWGGWNGWTLVPVLSSALGGIVIGLVTQHAGSVMKGFALIFGLFVTALVEWAVDGQGLRPTDWAAMGLVSLSIYIHTSFPLTSSKVADKAKND